MCVCACAMFMKRILFLSCTMQFSLDILIVARLIFKFVSVGFSIWAFLVTIVTSIG